MERILINAPIHPRAEEFLAQHGYAIRHVPMGDDEAAEQEARHCVGMVANAVLELGESFFDGASGLRVVGRMGVGVDTIDLAAASGHGVRVVNTPLPIVEPVAEHTLLLLLAVTRRLTVGDAAVRDGRWRTEETLPGPELRGKTLGLIGLGNTGRRVAEIATRGFGMKLVYHDRVERPDVSAELGAERKPLDELLSVSDFVSIHVSLTSETRHLLDRNAFRRMKPGAVLINVSRGPVVDEVALSDALRTGKLAGAGIDVFDNEPPARDHPLFTLPGVVLSPHVGGASTEAHLGCSMVVEDIVRVLKGEEPRHPVN